MAIYLDKEKESKLPFIYLFAPNHVKTLIAYFAIIRSGSIVVLVDPNIGRLELQEMMDITPPSALVYIDNNSLEFNYQREISFCKQTKQVDASGDLDGVCTIVYSSADDGYAKPIMLTRRNIFTNAQAIKDLVLGYVTEESVGCALLPFHS